jgi:hypothetical protein
MRFFKLVAIAGLAVTAAACASRTGDQTIAEYCANPDRANYDICKQHADTENVRTTLSGRIAEVFGVATDARSRADRAQSTADQAMARNMQCETRTLNNRQTGSCENGYTLTSCTQTRYTTRAGGMAILRSINDSECRFNGRVLEMQVRCCYVGATPPPTTVAAPTPPPPAPAPRQPTPTS